SRGVRSQQSGALLDVEGNRTLQAKRVARVYAGRDIHGPALGASSLDSAINRRRVYCPAVADGAETANVKNRSSPGARDLRDCDPQASREHRRGDQGRNAGQLEKFPADPVHSGAESGALGVLSGTSEP